MMTLLMSKVMGNFVQDLLSSSNHELILALQCILAQNLVRS